MVINDRGAIENLAKVKNGKRSTSSTSKIRKMRAIRKKRKEKGIREEPLWLNPHSKGLNLTRSKKVLFLSVKAKNATTTPRRREIKHIAANWRINY